MLAVGRRLATPFRAERDTSVAGAPAAAAACSR
jgi:hypothetical protein